MEDRRHSYITDDAVVTDVLQRNMQEMKIIRADCAPAFPRFFAFK